MQYREFAPAPFLRPYVRTYWELAAPAGPLEAIVPDGCAEIVVHFGEPPSHSGARQARGIFVGQMTGPTTLHADAPIGSFGIRFEPAGAWAILRVPQADLRDRIEPLDLPLERRLTEAGTSRERVAFANELLSRQLRLRDESRETQWVLACSRILDGSLGIGEFQEGLGVGVRQFERIFLHRVGLTPRLFARLARFRRALAMEATRIDAALQCGYYDQSHLLRDYRQFAGASPSHFQGDAFMSQSSNTLARS